jgi:GAF domain
MSVGARVAVVLISIGCVFWAVYNAVTPDRFTIGMFALQSDGAHARLIVAAPSPGPMQVHDGDELDVRATTVGDRIGYFGSAVTGSTIHVPLIRNGQAVTVAVVVPPGIVPPPRWIDLVLTILEAGFGIVVMIRAGTLPLARMVVWLAIVEQLGTVVTDFQYTAPLPQLSFYVGSWGGVFFEAATSFVAVWAAALLPGVRLKRTLLFAVVLAVLSFLTAVEFPVFAVPFPLVPTVWLNGLYAASFAVCLALAVAVAAMAQAAPADQRMRSMWFVSTLVGWFVGAALGAANSYLLNNSVSLFWTSYLLQSFTLLGPIYATLRHRILDLNFVITRSAIFAMLSVSMLGSFAAAEWGFGKLTDALIAGGFWKGVVAQLLSFSAAIVIGLYLRSVHGHLENWVNGILFRERIRKLALLESFARESDLLQTRSELLNVTYEALVDAIDADEVAVYIANDGALVCAHGSGKEPERLERSDRVVLQLLERQRPFVSEVPSLRDWLVIPLAVRREIVGAIACAPKRDHTAYLPDELRTLIDVAQHVATSYALLLPALGTTHPSRLADARTSG